MEKQLSNSQTSAEITSLEERINERLFSLEAQITMIKQQPLIISTLDGSLSFISGLIWGSLFTGGLMFLGGLIHHLFF